MYIHTGPNRRPVRLHTREWSPNIVMAKNSSHPLLLTPLLVCMWCWSCVVTPSHHCLCVCGDATVKNILRCQLCGRRAHTVTVHGAWIQRVLLLVCKPITLLVAVWKCIPSIYNKIEVGCKKGWLATLISISCVLGTLTSLLRWLTCAIQIYGSSLSDVCPTKLSSDVFL